MDSVIAADNVHAEAIERMMDAYGTAVLRMCYAFLKDYALAEDASQDTFIKAFRGLDAYKGAHQMSEKAWIMKIAINTCKDYRRAAWFRHVDRSVAAEELQRFSACSDASDCALMDEILSLPMKLREVVILHYYQGFGYQETAQALGISRSTMYERLKKARRKLHGALEGWDSDER